MLGAWGELGAPVVRHVEGDDVGHARAVAVEAEKADDGIQRDDHCHAGVQDATAAREGTGVRHIVLQGYDDAQGLHGEQDDARELGQALGRAVERPVRDGWQVAEEVGGDENLGEQHAEVGGQGHGRQELEGADLCEHQQHRGDARHERHVQPVAGLGLARPRHLVRQTKRGERDVLGRHALHRYRKGASKPTSCPAERLSQILKTEFMARVISIPCNMIS